MTMIRRLVMRILAFELMVQSHLLSSGIFGHPNNGPMGTQMIDAANRLAEQRKDVSVAFGSAMLALSAPMNRFDERLLAPLRALHLVHGRADHGIAQRLSAVIQRIADPWQAVSARQPSLGRFQPEEMAGASAALMQ